MNDLDRAILALQKSAAATPEFYRQLIRGEYWFPVPFHPEVEGQTLELKNGSPLPFVMLADTEGKLVPVFSSADRLNEGLKSGWAKGKNFSAGSLPALQLLEILGCTGLRAVINKSCRTGEVVIPPDLMRDLVSGKALQPLGTDGEAKGKRPLKILDPADYPTHLIQPVFESLRKHRNFRAAWIFQRAEEAATWYQLLILMQPRDEAVFHDVNMVLQAARRDTKEEIDLGLLDETDAGFITNLFSQVVPFYVAADYQKPPGAKGALG